MPEKMIWEYHVMVGDNGDRCSWAVFRTMEEAQEYAMHYGRGATVAPALVKAGKR